MLGREFSFELLHAVSPAPEIDLLSALEKLADAELIYAQGVPPEATYQFKHALIQNAAYEALLKTKRAALHQNVARRIVEKFPTIAEAQPEVLAHHWTEAGQADPAVTQWKKAGDRARDHRAFKEAETAYRQALAMIKSLPESPQRDERELDLVNRLVQALGITRGYSAPETIEAAAHARTLAEQSNNLADLVLEVYWSWVSAFVTGDHAFAALADQVLELAQRHQSERSLAFAHSAQLQVRFRLGDLLAAENHFAHWSRYREAEGYKEVPGVTVIVMAYASMNAWALGRIDAARERSDQMITFARDNKNPYDLAMGRFFEGYLYRWVRDADRAELAATEALALSKDHTFPFVADLARAVLGWAKAQRGRTGDGVALAREGLRGLTEADARVAITDHFTHLAEAEALDGLVGDAFGTIEVALKANSEDLIDRPNALTLRGNLWLKRGRSELAEVDFREAIALAKKMKAKVFELRAATGLARLLQSRGEKNIARGLLAPIYDWFSEGFDIADLKDARALLDELSA